MNRTATAVWKGTLKEGKGVVTTGSGVLKESEYSFKTRFESAPGTNPEELIAAAHAGCFSMALSLAISEAGHRPEKIETNAALSLDRVDGKWTIHRIHLDCRADVPGIDPAKFDELAVGAKENCPVSRALNAEITLTTHLAQAAGA